MGAGDKRSSGELDQSCLQGTGMNLVYIEGGLEQGTGDGHHRRGQGVVQSIIGSALVLQGG